MNRKGRSMKPFVLAAFVACGAPLVPAPDTTPTDAGLYYGGPYVGQTIHCSCDDQGQVVARGAETATCTFVPDSPQLPFKRCWWLLPDGGTGQ